jgi:hypothetical protein
MENLILKNELKRLVSERKHFRICWMFLTSFDPNANFTSNLVERSITAPAFLKIGLKTQYRTLITQI